MTSDPRMDEAFALYNAGDHPAAEKVCHSILETQPHEPVILHMLGVIAMAENRNEDALGFLTRAVAVSPGDHSVQTNLGNVLVHVRRYDEAIPCYEKAYAINGNELKYNFSMSFVYAATGRPHEAARCLLRVVEIHPLHADAISLLGPLLFELDDPEDTVLTFGDDIRIAVPDTLHQITPYILREQHQWFETEIEFVARFVEPGMQVIDIGANFGVYALTAARQLQGRGNVWAFEPASQTADYLERSVAENDFATLTVTRCALSDREGASFLSNENDSETNTLCEDGTDNTEPVSLTTLDACIETYGWQNIDFLKLDAEGHEENILKGGVRFFQDMSPIVLAEVIDKGVINWGLIDGLVDLGFQHFSYFPGLGILVPFVLDDHSTPTGINLFSCKPDTQVVLENKGLLISIESMTSCAATPDITGVWDEMAQHFPWYKRLFGEDGFGFPVDAGGPDHYADALALLLISETETAPPATRYHALKTSLSILEDLTSGEQPGLPRLLTLARVYGNFSGRSNLRKTLERILALHEDQGTFRIDEPFLPVLPDFDRIDPGDASRVTDWVLAQVLEQSEAWRHYSSYFTGPVGLENLDRLEATGFMRKPMRNRRDMIRTRYRLD